MKYSVEKSLWDFDFWGGAKQNAEELTEKQFEEVEEMMEEMQPDGWTETEINDFFWFDFDTIREWLGIEEEEEEEEEEED